METVTVYAAATPIAGNLPQIATSPPPAATAPNASPQSSPSSSDQSSNIALWVPIGIVIAVAVLFLLSWACVSRRVEFRRRAQGDPDAIIGQTRDKRTGDRVFVTKANMQKGRYGGRGVWDDGSSD